MVCPWASTTKIQFTGHKTVTCTQYLTFVIIHVDNLCRGGDVPLSVEHIRYYAGWADKIHGKIVPTSGKFYAQVYKEPLGEQLLHHLFQE